MTKKEAIKIEIKYHIPLDLKVVWADNKSVGTIQTTEKYNFPINVYWN